MNDSYDTPPRKTMSVTNDAEQPLLAGHAAGPINKGKITLAKVRAVLMPRRKYIMGLQLACVVFYVCAIFAMAHDGRVEYECRSLHSFDRCHSTWQRPF
jgi:hypothetical protein